MNIKEAKVIKSEVEKNVQQYGNCFFGKGSNDMHAGYACGLMDTLWKCGYTLSFVDPVGVVHLIKNNGEQID